VRVRGRERGRRHRARRRRSVCRRGSSPSLFSREQLIFSDSHHSFFRLLFLASRGKARVFPKPSV
jgi:hypothetical protein